MKTLLIDNYDSFSRILFQYLWEVNGEKPIFIRNDELSLDAIGSERFDNILISPGPGRPDRKRDFGVCMEVIAAFPRVPILGVCLGHQGLGLFAGASVAAAPQVRHGKVSRILHDGTGLFAGLPQAFPAVRYHSLVIEPGSVPDSLVVTATAEDDGQIMAVRLKGRPAFGVQFHPESIGTEGGKILLANFRELTASLAGESKALHGRKAEAESIQASRSVPDDAQPRTASVSGAMPSRELPWRDPEAVFASLFRDRPASFWLDSLAEPVSGEPLFSYMGTGSRLIEIRGGGISIRDVGGDAASGSAGEKIEGDPFEYLDRYLRVSDTPRFPETDMFPGSFRGGLVGYFGYGMKSSAGAPEAAMPDGLFLEPDRILAFDHVSRKVRAFLPGRKAQEVQEVQASGGNGQSSQSPQSWLDGLPSIWDAVKAPPLNLRRFDGGASAPASLKLPWKLSAAKGEYLARIRSLQDAIRSGESYEACLTNEASVQADADPFLVYRLLRRTNPSPYAAYLGFPQGCVLSASPERFLKLDASGALSSRPIKGTRRRGATPEEDADLKADLSGNAKDRSENLMIVDLVRHDFGEVCAPGSVRVSEFMVVEEHPTVLQLVSGISGRLDSGRGAMDAVRACFPGGSMTGAPKLRTMELLAAQERRARGVFSGALGYLGWDGAMDLGMVIRTLVSQKGVYSVGCGGAILAESDPEEEFAEAMLKAFASQRALELAILKECGGWKVSHTDETG
jgi:para-aminobenzoate synthetase